jgi:uncharacterized surface protein with fasciclin (FAS1) repeats
MPDPGKLAPRNHNSFVNMKRIPEVCSSRRGWIAALVALLTLCLRPAGVQAQTGSIVDIAVGNTNFSILVTAVQRAGLVEALSGPGPLTVFAPDNAAFARLPAGTLEALLVDTNRLRQILLYHVAPGLRTSGTLSNASIVTVQGAAATVRVSEGVVTIDGARVTAADVLATNGVIHVIDNVILPPPTIVGIAAGNTNFSTLVAAAQAAGLVDTLNSDGPFTVFAPTDAAFARLPAGTIPALLADPNRLRQILLYHVVPGRVRSTDLVAGPVTTAQGSRAAITLAGGPRINDANIIATDIEASNGVIHVIDNVILPPPTLLEIAAGNTNFITLTAAVRAAGLTNLLSGDRALTVFAPTDAAFARLPAGTVEGLLANPARLRQVLRYHLLPSRVRSSDLVAGRVITSQGAAVTISLTNGARINGVTISATDIEAGNGVIHVIDEVLLPPPDLVDLAAGVPSLSTLVTAIQAAGLVEHLKMDGPFTVFAPNNDAFARLPAGLLNQLLADTNRLRHILLYHVVEGPRLRAGNIRAGSVTSLQGAPVRLALTNGSVRVNQATVIGADVEALNAIVHVIDDVILPGDGFTSDNLSITEKAGTATVVWATRAGETYRVERRATLGAGPWEPATNAIVQADGVGKIDVPVVDGSALFRLIRTR